MDRDSRKMRGERPFVFTNIRAGLGVPEVAAFIEQARRPGPKQAPEPGPMTTRVCLLGATGTIGRATLRALTRRGHDVVAFVRPAATPPAIVGAEFRAVNLSDPRSIAHDGIRGERFDALVSCMASRTGAPQDAWAVDHQAHLHALAATTAAGIRHVVLLSAICVQKPRLAFQHAKLAFEAALIQSGLTYSIVRPTAYFKSLSGQIERLERGKPFLMFQNGARTACKPIGDDDLAAYLVDCLHDETRRDRILPIGGPGPAITPRDQAEALFALLGRKPRFRQVPLALLDTIVHTLAAAARIAPSLAAKAELARIGRYYATESMLLLNPENGLYDAAATPETGTDTLFDHYRSLIAGDTAPERRDHAVF